MKRKIQNYSIKNKDRKDGERRVEGRICIKTGDIEPIVIEVKGMY